MHVTDELNHLFEQHIFFSTVLLLACTCTCNKLVQFDRGPVLSKLGEQLVGWTPAIKENNFADISMSGHPVIQG